MDPRHGVSTASGGTTVGGITLRHPSDHPLLTSLCEVNTETGSTRRPRVWLSGYGSGARGLGRCCEAGLHEWPCACCRWHLSSDCSASVKPTPPARSGP